MRKSWMIAAAVLAMTGCREADGPLGNGGGGRLVVKSDPGNGRIFVDGRSTGRFTPDTVTGLGGLHDIVVELDTVGLTYRYGARIVVTGTEPTVLEGPLLARCLQQVNTCSPSFSREHTVGTLRFRTNALGPVFLEAGQGGGLYWPATSSNNYMSTGSPVFAARWGDQAVSTGIYDTEFLAGRPAPSGGVSSGVLTFTQKTWILPPGQLLQFVVARGLEVRERVVASAAQDGVVLVELTFRNITNDPMYRRLDGSAEVQGAGITYENAWIGFALDPDIGVANDDWISYDESLSAVFAYDAAFQEPEFSTQNAAPALVGLRVLRAPAGATRVLNGWVNTASTPDWQAGTVGQAAGLGILSGAQSYAPDHPGQAVGHLPPQAGDARIVASVGPLRLAPGDSAKAVFAVALAAPTADTFQSGSTVTPGTPGDAARPLHAIAANLRSRLVAAESLLPLLGQ